MSLSATTIATAIAALSVTGVTMLDLDKIPADASRAGLPCFFPDPENWGGALTATVKTLGIGSAYWECNRTLGYLYLHAMTGSGRVVFQYFDGMSDNRDTLIEKLLELDVSGVDVIGVTSSPFIASIKDPAGNSYLGIQVGVIVRERVNA